MARTSHAATARSGACPVTADVGTLVVTVTASDKAGASASTDFALRVVNVNDLPALVSRLADQTVGPGPAVRADPVRGCLHGRRHGSWRQASVARPWVPMAARCRHGSLRSRDATFSGIPRDADAGRSVITVVATDSVGDEAAGSFSSRSRTSTTCRGLPSDPRPGGTVSQRFALELDPGMFPTPTWTRATRTDHRAARGPLAAPGVARPSTARPSPSRARPADRMSGPLAVSVIAVDRPGRQRRRYVLPRCAPRDGHADTTGVVHPQDGGRRGGKLPVILDWSSGRRRTGPSEVPVESRSGARGWSKYRTLIGAVRADGHQQVHEALAPTRSASATTPRAGHPANGSRPRPSRSRTLQESDKSIEYQGPWSKADARGALGEQVRRSPSPGDSFRVTVTGSADSLVMTRARVRASSRSVSIRAAEQASCRTVDLSTGRKSPRNVITNFRNLAPGEHTSRSRSARRPRSWTRS